MYERGVRTDDCDRSSVAKMPNFSPYMKRLSREARECLQRSRPEWLLQAIEMLEKTPCRGRGRGRLSEGLVSGV